MAEPYPPFDGTQACAGLPEPAAAAYLPGGLEVAAAKERCRGCPFWKGCRGYGLTHDVQGVWGGLDDVERRAHRRRAGTAEPAAVADQLDELVRAWRRPARRTS